jgi:LysM domain
LLYKFDRIFVRSNVQTIEQGYYRTVVRYREAAMGMTSAAEAKLDARIRPEIAVLRSRTPYPRRSRGRAIRRHALAVLPGGAEAGRVVCPASDGADAAAAIVARERDAAEAPVDRAAVVRAGAGVPVDRDAAVSDAVVRDGARQETARGDAGLHGSVSRPAAAPAGPLRLTRRGKVVVGALVAVVVAGLAAVIWLAIAGQAEAAGPGMAGAGPGAGHTMVRVVVRPGETLWSIAVRTDPRADPRAVIQQIIDDNALRGSAIQQGQVLWVPRL